MIKPDKDGVFWGRCDYAECDKVFLTDRKNIDEARKTLIDHGWTITGQSVFCVARHKQDAVAKRLQEMPVPGEVMAAVQEKFKDWDHEDLVNHPSHYGGADNVYEAIKVIEAWQLDFNLGNCVKYIARHRHKGKPLEDLKKARWYLERAIQNLEKSP